MRSGKVLVIVNFQLTETLRVKGCWGGKVGEGHRLYRVVGEIIQINIHWFWHSERYNVMAAIGK